MAKSLVIVESPAKAKTINKYLGNDYIVKSSVGHIRDIERPDSANRGKKGKNQVKLTPEEKHARNMGIDPWHDWRIQYREMPDKKKVIDELRFLAKNAPAIYLATDLDREGEAIAWHLREVIGGDLSRYKRVTFNEITKSAIQKAFTEPRDIDMLNVNAQQARRCLDRVVGFMLSPLLWSKVTRGLSAGRVQSVATRLIVEREQEIKEHIPIEYWDIAVLVSKLDDPKHNLYKFPLNLIKFGNENVDDKFKQLKLVNKAFRDSILDQLKVDAYTVSDVKSKETSSNPKGPFTTSTLQQAASTFLGYGVKRTMGLAQKLYEKGYITYMRTDSMNISQEALVKVRDEIVKKYGEEYLSPQPIHYASRQDAQEAHEAIRPSNPSLTHLQLEDVEDDARKLYKLISDRFFSCQMKPAKYSVTELLVKEKDCLLQCQGRTTLFAGWTKAMEDFIDDRDDKGKYVILPNVKVGDKLHFQSFDCRRKETKPPARYNEASLVKSLERRGIGRPSTYATIISTIVERGYVTKEGKVFTATNMGEIVTSLLMKHFGRLMDYDFTALMEKSLDDIVEDKKDWKDVLNYFFWGVSNEGFYPTLLKASLPAVEGGMEAVSSLNDENRLYHEIHCPKCHSPMQLRLGKEGYFLGCSTFRAKEPDSCHGTLNLKNEPDGKDIRKCPKCQGKMDRYRLNNNAIVYLCRDSFNCNGHYYEVPKEGLKEVSEVSLHDESCPECKVPYHVLKGRFGPYVKCPSCNTMRGMNEDGSLRPVKKPAIDLPELPCQAKGAHFVLREGQRGLFLAAHNFPKVRETRPVKVNELIRFKDRLPNHLLYLTTAPTEHDGAETIVKYDVKLDCICIGTQEKNDKTRYYYQNDAWVTI